MSACSFTLNGEPCTTRDADHFDLHVTEDQNQKKAA